MTFSTRCKKTQFPSFKTSNANFFLVTRYYNYFPVISSCRRGTFGQGDGTKKMLSALEDKARSTLWHPFWRYRLSVRWSSAFAHVCVLVRACTCVCGTVHFRDRINRPLLPHILVAGTLILGVPSGILLERALASGWTKERPVWTDKEKPMD